VRDLEQEVEKSRRDRAEEVTARAKLGVLEHRVDLLRTSLRGYRELFPDEKVSAPQVPDSFLDALAMEMEMEPLDSKRTVNFAPEPVSREESSNSWPLKRDDPTPPTPTTSLREFVRSQTNSRQDPWMKSQASASVERESLGNPLRNSCPLATLDVPMLGSPRRSRDGLAAESSWTTPVSAQAERQGNHDAMQFLCDYVAREEERLAFTPRLT
jgi:hypothetical protein